MGYGLNWATKMSAPPALVVLVANDVALKVIREFNLRKSLSKRGRPERLNPRGVLLLPLLSAPVDNARLYERFGMAFGRQRRKKTRGAPNRPGRGDV